MSVNDFSVSLSPQLSRKVCGESTRTKITEVCFYKIMIWSNQKYKVWKCHYLLYDYIIMLLIYYYWNERQLLRFFLFLSTSICIAWLTSWISWKSAYFNISWFFTFSVHKITTSWRTLSTSLNLFLQRAILQMDRGVLFIQ